MSVPVLPSPSGFDAGQVVEEDRAGCEFVNGGWREKHPSSPLRKYHDRKGFEFVDGEWKEKNLSGKSSRIAIRLSTRLDTHAESERLGFVLDSETAYQIFSEEPRRTRKPDLSFVRLGRLPNDEVPDGNMRIPPDLAVEVVSPNDEAVDLNNKIMEYLGAGVKLIWVLYPQTKSVLIVRPDGTANWLAGEAELTGEAVVPGFKVNISSLFQEYH